MAKRRKQHRRFKITPASVAGLILLAMLLTVYGVYAYKKTGTVVPTMELLDGHANFRFLDVGQGDCTLITHRGDSILIDAGPASSGMKAAEMVAMYAPSVDYFIITHPHEDHMGGAADILKRVKVECLVLPAEQTDEAFYREALKMAERKGVPVLIAEDSMTLATDALTAEILDTFSLVTDNLNDRSMAVRVTAEDTTLLVTGDSEMAEEEYLLNHFIDDLDADILKVPHHGSDTSSSAEFLSAVSPDSAVISCGKNNSYGHPSSAVLNRLEQCTSRIYRTDRQGTVVLREGGTFWEWLTSLNHPAA